MPGKQHYPILRSFEAVAGTLQENRRLTDWRDKISMQMSGLIRTAAALVAAFTAALFATVALAQTPPQSPLQRAAADRWEETLAAFAAADLKNAPSPGSVLFV